ncbi:MAG: hypothetical protein AB1758_01475 [Candidatus Eremiobacterota bacterium]
MRRLGTGQVLSDGLRLYGIVFPFVAGMLAVTHLPLDSLSIYCPDRSFGSFLGPPWYQGAMVVVVPLITAATLGLLSTAAGGERPTWNDAARGARRFGSLLLTLFLMRLFVLVGVFLLVVPGLYLLLCYAVAAPVAVLENRSPSQALDRSIELTKGNLLKILAVFGLLYAVILSLGLGFGAAALLFPVLQSPVSQLLAGFAVTLVEHAGVALSFAIYWQLTRGEEVRAEEAGVGLTPPVSE